MRVKGTVTRISFNEGTFTAGDLAVNFHIETKWVGAEPPEVGMPVIAVFTDEGILLHVFPGTSLLKRIKGAVQGLLHAPLEDESAPA